MQRKKGSKRIEMIIKMVNEFNLTIVHFARPNPMQICACAWIYRWTKNGGKSGLDRTGLPGRRASRPRGCRGPWAAGRWAAGLLLAKPIGVGPLRLTRTNNNAHLDRSRKKKRQKNFLIHGELTETNKALLFFSELSDNLNFRRFLLNC